MVSTRSGLARRDAPVRFAWPIASSPPLLLQRYDAFVTHEGFDNAKEALREGVATVVVPITADQPDWRRALRRARRGPRLTGAADRSPDAIQQAAEELLDDPAIAPKPASSSPR